MSRGTFEFKDNCVNWVINEEKKYEDIKEALKDSLNVKVFYLGYEYDFSEMSSFKSLQVIYIKSMDEMTFHIKNFKNLIALRINEGLIKLSPLIGELTLLRELNLSDCKLKSLPKEIGRLTNLRYLFLDDNELKTLPKEIGNMKNLRYLFISNNQLESLPEEIGQLGNLEELWLETNQIKSIPKSIGNCKKLKYVHMSGNLLMDVPVEINNIESLVYFRITSNKIPQEKLKELKKKIPKLSY
ncbi:hypothetical protein AD998_08310 [bacterium 336/3]|nr:hypothetical protein AD998_08310 [bacterium 336/3]